ncbi:acyltransferase family protein [Nocardiopsis composta]|uniref:Peptidoglycan/LPS O-acetylase OafA/YrhL n=1 Tax=Nocardiopsis composta TaxID=157465 RepID=A0A7W8VC60_9ACTN|nr:acyltransferase family protein [Nocardiopsis composta]MBB5430539.1 peptidoglycan/LPS O-acetylase OafA/YrhL [Nocardiopsis composta]
MTTGPSPGARTHPAPAGPAPRPRLAYIDNLRILLTVLVVLHHCAVTYGNIPIWFYTEPAQDPTGVALDLLVVFNQAFFMGFFFLISGFFTPGSADRKGARPFLRDRLVRLGVPLLLFALLARPLLTYGIYTDHLAGELPYWLFYIVSWDPGPMWFVETLLVFCLAYLLTRRFRAPRQDRIAERRTGRMPGPAAVLGFTAGLIALTVLWRLLVPAGSYWPVLGLPSPAFLPQYALMFTAGALAFRRGWFDSVPRAAGWGGLAMVAVGLALFPLNGDPDVPTTLWSSLVGAAFESIFAVGMVLFLIRLFQRFFDRQGPFARFLSDNAFAVYFLHALVLVGIGYALSGWEAPAIAKFGAMAALALPLTWGAAHLMRSLPLAKRVF